MFVYTPKPDKISKEMYNYGHTEMCTIMDTEIHTIVDSQKHTKRYTHTPI